MPGKLRVEVPYERVEVKLPMGLYRKLEAVLRAEQTWPSRQDFIIDAVREKLDCGAPSSPDVSPSPRRHRWVPR
jgi:hypothetical protein